MSAIVPQFAPEDYDENGELTVEAQARAIEGIARRAVFGEGWRMPRHSRLFRDYDRMLADRVATADWWVALSRTQRVSMESRCRGDKVDRRSVFMRPWKWAQGRVLAELADSLEAQFPALADGAVQAEVFEEAERLAGVAVVGGIALLVLTREIAVRRWG